MAKRAVRLILIGGFLGAGKTTSMSRLAKHFTDQKLRVGLITNDQADNLVDTHLVKIEGFNVEEVTGGCFCCKYNDLTNAGKRLLNQIQPDVILAEPVGSCTDLAATVVQPLKAYAKDDYSLAPYTVLVDPVRIKEIIVSSGTGGFSDKVIYIFKKQLEEADIIALNKIDTLNHRESGKLLKILRKKFPQAKIIGMSALTGEGFDNWLRALEDKGSSGRNIAEVDYEVYAEGEAELAWLNLVADFSSPEKFDVNKFLANLTENIRKGLSAIHAEVAHLKLVFSAPHGSSSINLTGTNQTVKFFRKDAGKAKKGQLLVNARVHIDPESLNNIATSALKDLSKKSKINIKIKSFQSFRPGKPIPTHRFKTRGLEHSNF
ncbi:MAG: GTP-binding protein [Candidatus Omnitrophota bacterium]